MKYSNNFHLKATVSEVQRYAAVAPLGLAHQKKASVELEGFSFPPNAIFMSNLHFIMRDPRHFQDPEVFNPHRFIEDGRLEIFKYLLIGCTVLLSGIRRTQPWYPSELVRGSAWGRLWLGMS